jgi:TRAP-type C4-dicarboxylate transport system permease small subunit
MSGETGKVKTHKLKMEPKKVARFLTILFLVIFIAHIASKVSEAVFNRTFGLFFFDMASELSLPTYISAIALFACSVVLAVIALMTKSEQKRESWYWSGLAVIFLYLSIDEIIKLHEKMSRPVREALNTSGFLELAWVIPYGIFVVVFVLVYLRFLRSLPRQTRNQFIVAGIAYVTGAIGFELLSGNQLALHGERSIGYIALVTVEESLELGGTLVFLYALVSYISTTLGGVRISIGLPEE